MCSDILFVLPILKTARPDQKTAGPVLKTARPEQLMAGPVLQMAAVDPLQHHVHRAHVRSVRDLGYEHVAHAVHDEGRSQNPMR